jgi:hypothetical protein
MCRDHSTFVDYLPADCSFFRHTRRRRPAKEDAFYFEELGLFGILSTDTNLPKISAFGDGSE